MSHGCEYDLSETIGSLDGWANHGKRMYPIETAFSAVHWLERMPAEAREWPCFTDGYGATVALSDTLNLLRGWLSDDTPNMPDRTGEAALHWLKLMDERQSR